MFCFLLIGSTSLFAAARWFPSPFPKFRVLFGLRFLCLTHDGPIQMTFSEAIVHFLQLVVEPAAILFPLTAPPGFLFLLPCHSLPHIFRHHPDSPIHRERNQFRTRSLSHHGIKRGIKGGTGKYMAGTITRSGTVCQRTLTRS